MSTSASTRARLLPADVDTDDNLLDFQVLDTPTPGSAPVSVAEPAGSSLLLAGLAALKRGRPGRRRSGPDPATAPH